MRTHHEIRSRMLDLLALAFLRPGMFGGELYYHVRLEDLAHIDGLEGELARHLEDLNNAGINTCLGITGWFERRFPGYDLRDLDDEVASVYGGVAARLGWLSPARALDRDELADVKRRALSMVRGDATLETVEAELGPPSFAFGDVRAYASEDSAVGWVYFDFSHFPHEPGHHDRATAPPTSFRLRNVRVPTRHWYSERFRFTPLGRQLRDQPNESRVS